ncbi:hypothetical protein QVD17_37135 [Tagetes erecta]|uniref:P-loop containing nucleoside triphosphate hydrolases superfamily protein n=1 Tax=Tagetes erecta TaxID=13708 RepID=A0AAD8NJS8_TARER|nr:hypothetical protein QVD17_37135 [Tagetes erecta]
MASSSWWRKPETKKPELVDVVFTWSIDDVLKRDLYPEVPEIPDIFSSSTEYSKSFMEPLIEETHAELRSKVNAISRASTRGFMAVFPRKDDKFPNDYLYSIHLVKGGSEMYEPEVGDLIALTNDKPRRVNDLKPYIIASVQGVNNDVIQVKSSIFIPAQKSRKGGVVVHLMNLTTNNRMWQALQSCLGGKNTKMINKVLQIDSMGNQECTICSIEDTKKSVSPKLQEAMCSFNLNASQETAVWSCITARECRHQETVNLIWGPPGTGKTKTVGCLLFALWKMKCCTLTCAPTNNAVLEVAARFMSLVIGSLEDDSYGFGDIVVSGNGKRMKIDGFQELELVFLENRVSALAACLSPTFGWRNTAKSMINLLKSPEDEYNLYLRDGRKVDDDELSIREFVTKKFKDLEEQLTTMVRKLCTHMPTSFVTPQLAEKMFTVIRLVQSICISEEKVITFTNTKEFLQTVKEVLCETASFLTFADDQDIGNFCLRNARLIFCTATGSSRLHTLDTNVELLVVDEAGLLRECESVIPLQLSGLRDVVLIGDEQQLSATVKSKVKGTEKFGRSLFERLVLLKHTRHLLNVQYRMHPAISRFPNKEFYDDRLQNGPNVEVESYTKQFLEGDIFGSYSFIHLAQGKIEYDKTYSGKNMVEVNVIVELLAKLHEESDNKNQKISVGCIAPYKYQVTAIQNKIGKIYQGESDFSVKIDTVDGFQGREEDVIIISTVTGGADGSLGFLKTPQRANVALTRARHCLWILGNGDTLKDCSETWEHLVDDAKVRGCYHQGHEDKYMGQLITNALVKLGQFNSLLDINLLLFKEAKWKVIISDDFLKSVSDMKSPESNKEVYSALMKLSGGQHPVETVSQGSALIKIYMVNCKGLRVVWSIDIMEENKRSVQVLRIWDVWQGTSVSKLKQLRPSINRFYHSLSDEKQGRCREKNYEGNLVVPKIWPMVDENHECLLGQIGAMSLTKEVGSSSSDWKW